MQSITIGVPISRIATNFLVGLIGVLCALSTFWFGDADDRQSMIRIPLVLFAIGFTCVITASTLRARRRKLAELTSTYIRDVSKDRIIPWKAIRRILVQKGWLLAGPFRQWITFYLEPSIAQAHGLPQMLVVNLEYASKQDFTMALRWIEQHTGVSVEEDSIGGHFK